MPTTLKCTVGRETYEIEIELPDAATILSIVRSSDYAPDEFTSYDHLGPFIQSRIDRAVRAAVDESRRAYNMP